MDVPAIPDHNEVNSRTRERIPALARIEEGINQEEARIPALERIEIPEKIPPRATGLSSSLLARLQDVEVHYAENEHLSPLMEAESGRGTLITLGSGTLQNSRVPATLRLGSGSGTKKKLNPSKLGPKKTSQAKPPKRKAPASVKGTTRTRGNRSPLQGTKFTRQMTTRAKTSTRKRLCVDRSEPIQELPFNKDDAGPSRVNTQGKARNKVDFQNPPNPIP